MSGTGTRTVITPPGGRALDLTKRLAETVLWARVALQVRRARPRRHPAPQPPTDVLRDRAQWEEARAEARRLHLPLHPDRPKNWDALGAVSAVLDLAGDKAAVLDAGSARYSPILPWLRLYGFTDLTGINLEFDAEKRHSGVVFRYGDITASGFPDGRFDAVTCMSVIEHGVPVEAFLRETARILRPGGVLVLSTDYDQQPPDTSGLEMYGRPVRIFSPADIEALVRSAGDVGLELVGPLRLEHAERPVHWRRTGLDYTFIRLTFRRA